MTGTENSGFSVAWLLVILLVALMVQQNAELDLAPFACKAGPLKQLYDVMGFLAGFVHNGADHVAACTAECARQIVKSCGVSSDDEVLELGFGTGSLAYELLERRRVRRYDGIEMSEAMLNLTAGRFAEPGRMHLHLHDEPLELLQSSPTLLTSYSQVFAIFVLDLMVSADIVLALQSLHQRLKAGGRACFAVMADTPRELSVALYKTAWRIAPTAFFGRRPLSLERFILDEERWLPVTNWTDWSGWLPVQFFVLEKVQAAGTTEAEAAELQHQRLTAIRRWARHLQGAGASGEEQGLLDWRSVILASVQGLPVGVAQDVVRAWLPELASATVIALIRNDISTMSKNDMIGSYRQWLVSLPTAQLMQQMRFIVRSWDTASLEDFMKPNLDGMGVEELREYINNSLTGVMQEVQNDLDMVAELIEHQEAAASLTTLEELQELNKYIEDNVLAAPTDLTREELEAGVTEYLEHLPRKDIEEEILSDIKAFSASDLREQQLADVQEMGREELLDRAREAVEQSEAQALLPALREIARTRLSSEDIEEMVRGLAEFTANGD